MSNENTREDVHDDEQITKIPDEKPAKVPDARKKDPKKVAAGKKLAEYNKKAKEALAREMKRDAEAGADSEETKTSEGESWLPELSFSTVLTLFGIGVTVADLFFRFYGSKTEKDTCSPNLTPVHTIHTAHTVHTPPEKSSAPFLATPRIGMV